MMTSNDVRRRISVFFVVMILLAGHATASPPELPSSSGASRPDVVRQTSTAAAQNMAHSETAGLAHPVENGSSLEGTAPISITFQNLSPFEEPQTGRVRYHIQGQLRQEGPLDQEPLGGQPAISREDLPAPELPREIEPGSAGEQVEASLVATNFDGLANTGWIPPDTVVAVGSSAIVEAVNSGFSVYSKSGAVLQGNTTFSTFFNSLKPVGWAGFMYDPRVIWSEEHQKFVILILGLDQTNQTSYYFIGISQTSNPTGSWWAWRFVANPAPDTNAWLDFASLGADSWGLYVTGNYFLWTGSFKYSVLWSLNPAMFSGGASNGWRFWDLRWPNSSFAFSLQAAHPHSIAGGQETFFVNTLSSSGNQMLLWELTGDRTNAPSLIRSAIGITAYDAIGENIDQPGSSIDLDGGDARIVNAVYSQRRVYAALTTDPFNDGSASGAILTKLNVDTLANEWSHLLWGGTGVYFFYPAVTIDGSTSTTPDIAAFISWTWPATSVYASSAVKLYTNHPASTAGAFPGLVNGAAAYVLLDGSGRNRWGDYSGAGYDWARSSFWGATEYAGTSNTWRTRIAEISTAIFSDGFESGNTSAWSF